MDIDAGSLVCAKAGRDKGEVFVVMHLSEGFCYLANGKNRKADNPKKKKLKHVTPESAVAENLKEKIALGERPTNSEIRRAIRAFLEESNESS